MKNYEIKIGVNKNDIIIKCHLDFENLSKLWSELHNIIVEQQCDLNKLEITVFFILNDLEICTYLNPGYEFENENEFIMYFINECNNYFKQMVWANAYSF